MTNRFYKHRVDTVCNSCNRVIQSAEAECISKERRNSANDNQYIDSDESVNYCSEECEYINE